MASITRRPSRTSSRIMAAPSYQGVASSFSSQFSAAITEQRRSRFDNMVTSYMDGGTSYEELQKFVKDYVDEVGQDTNEGSSALSTLVKLQATEKSRVRETKRSELEARYVTADGSISAEDRYKIEQELLGVESPGSKEFTAQQQRVISSFDEAQTEAVAKRRIELIDQFKSGGITPQEDLAITQELRAMANPDSTVYAQLVEQEARLLTSISTAGGTTNKTNALDFQAADTVSKLDSLQRQHQLGVVDGLTAAKAEQELYNQLYDTMVQMAQDGIAIDRGLLTQAQQGATFAQEKVGAYENGILFDVITKDGSVRSITPDGRDIQTGKTADYLNDPVQYNPLTQDWSVVNEEGEVVGRNITSESAARLTAKEMNLVSKFKYITKELDGSISVNTASRLDDGRFKLYGAGPEGEDLVAKAIAVDINLANQNDIFEPQLYGSDIPQVVQPVTDIPPFTQTTSIDSSPIMDWARSTGLLPDIPEMISAGEEDKKNLQPGLSIAGQTTDAQKKLREVTAGQNLGIDSTGQVTRDGQAGRSGLTAARQDIRGPQIKLPGSSSNGLGSDLGVGALKSSISGLNFQQPQVQSPTALSIGGPKIPKINLSPISQVNVSTPNIKPVDLSSISLSSGANSSPNFSGGYSQMPGISQPKPEGLLSKIWGGIKGLFGR